MAAPAAGFDEDPPSELAAVLVRKAKRAEKAGDLAQAYVYYTQASALQPRNRGYRSRAAELQKRGADQIRKASTTGSVNSGSDVVVPPEDLFESETAREFAGERQLSSPPRLSATPGRFDFDLNDTQRKLFEAIAARYNLQLVFDGDYPTAGPQIRFRVSQVDYRGALDMLQAATASFVVPLSSRAIMVAKDTVAKRNDLEQTVALTVRVPQVITTQELTEIVQVVRQATGVEKIGWETNDDEVVVRDRISRAAPAQALLEQLFSYRPEVMIDLELLQVSTSDILNYGFTVTNSFPLAYLGGIQNSVASLPSGVTNLVTFGAGYSLIGLGVAQVQAMFNQTYSDARSLFSAQLREGSGQAGAIHVGEKYPIITSGFVGASATNTSGSTSPTFAAPPAISFENLGLDLKITPSVHGDDEVSMTIDASYEVLTGDSADGIPVIGTDKMTTSVRLRNDEWSVVGGLIGNTKTKSSAGFWGLENLPWIGNLFRQTTVDKETSNLLIGVRPHILYVGPDGNVAQPLRVGTDARPYTPL
jgi:type II secretory pathway component GspD/PulD (secretin)